MVCYIFADTMPNKLKHIFCVLAMLFVATYTCAQQYSYKHYTILDGLVQNQITTLYQDRQGYIWVGTKGGASRFDGLHFKNYTADDGLPTGLVQGFLELHNELYCYTANGISVLRNGRFELIYTLPKPQLENIKLNSDSTKAYIVLHYEILQANKIGIHSIYTFHEKTLIGNFCIDPETEKLIFSNSESIFSLDKKNALKTIYNSYCGRIININRHVYFVLENVNSKNNLNGIYKLMNEKPTKVFNGYPKPMFGSITLNRNGNIVCFLDNSSWAEIDTNGKVLDQDSLPNIIITEFICDREGNYWFGTETGLYCLQSFAFRNYGEKSGIPSYVWSIMEAHDSAMVFAGFGGGLGVLKKNKVTIIPKAKYMMFNDDKFYMDGMCNSRGDGFLPMEKGHILIYDGKKFVNLILKFSGEYSVTLCTYEDIAEHLMYFGGTNGLFIYNIVDKSQKNYATEGHNVLYVEADKFNRKWICTNAKIYLFEHDSLKEMHLPGMENKSAVVSCKRDPRGNMWLACKSGLYLYNWKHYIKFSGGQYSFISLYQNRYLIAGAITGFLYIDLDTFYAMKPDCFRFFDRYNGFTGIECGQNGTCTDSKGNVWIPTSESVVKFMPYRLKKNTLAPTLNVYSFEISGNDLKWDNIFDEYSETGKTIKLTYDKHNIRITYQGISLSCPEKVNYKTRLVGYDNTWSEPNNEKTAVYTNLSPGRYTFEILACNADGVWTEKPLQVNFVIMPAFWQTWWFILLAVLVFTFDVVAIVYFIMRARRKKEQKQRAIEKELVSMQIKTINAQIDPHFVFNAITAIGAEVQENNAERAYSYFVKVSNLLRNSLKNNEKMIRPLSDEIDFVNNYLVLQKFRFGERFEYVVNVSEDTDLKFEIPKMCIQTFVENAMKHGLEHKKAGGLLQVNINTQNKLLIAEIIDNGIGRIQAEKFNLKSTGVGLNTLRQFFKIFNSYNSEKAGFYIEDLFNESGEASGTKVILSIPLSYKFIV